MKIGVDAGCLAVTDKRLKVGVYQVTFNLLKELGKIDRRTDFLLFSFQPIEKKIMRLLGPRFKNIVALPKKGWRFFALPKSLYLNKVDLFIGPSQALPYFCPCSSLVIVHDLGFEHYPWCYSESYRQLRRITRQAVKKANLIVAVSLATKKDLIKFYRVPQEKIKVVYEGVDPFFKPVKDKKTVPPYFLFVGALKPIKNIPFLLQGFARFLTQTKKNFFLVLSGGDLWLDPEIPRKIKELNLSKNLRQLGFVPEKDLPALYSGATAFVSPSLYEGFGLTLLEAMACGCPVIAGNTGAQPEVVGKAGILVDLTDVAALTQAMLKISTDLKFRSQLAAVGLVRAKQFSWEKFAQKIIYSLSEQKCDKLK